ncbi:MAG: hypothetical protein M0Z67_16600 [Nitrospiraceae bacterium]|nr:hypothetical protein [Nitrospiraceae bacterium]
MAEFKNKEEYEKWKVEKAKKAQGGVLEKSAKPDSTLTLSRNMVIIMAVILIATTATIVYFITKPTPQPDKQVEASKAPQAIPPQATPVPTVQKPSEVKDTGKISGNIFVSMKSGDVKKAAGIKVMLLKNYEQVASEYDQILGEYKQQSMPMLLKAQQGFAERKNVRVRDEREYFEESTKNNFMKVDLLSKLGQLDRTYNQKFAALFSANLYKTVQSDVNGYYEFGDIPYGKYFLLSEFTVFDSRSEWLLTVDVQQKENRYDLSNSNAKDTVYMHFSEQYGKTLTSR